MAGHVQIDTAAMQATAQQSTNIAEQMLGHATTLKNSVDVLQRWQGQAGDAFRMVMMENLGPLLDKLIHKLQFIADTMKDAGLSFDGHEAAARTKLTAPGQNLSAVLNF
jgi:WXG100 family type VII secretion target